PRTPRRAGTRQAREECGARELPCQGNGPKVDGRQRWGKDWRANSPGCGLWVLCRTLPTSMASLTPEQQARETIDAMLVASGWVVQDIKAMNVGAATGVAVREYPTDTGPADYILFVHRKPVGVVEAKKADQGEKLTVHEDQTEGYAAAKLKWTIGDAALPFCYLSTGAITKHWDMRDPKPRAREIFSFHRPETMVEWLKEPSLRTRLTQYPPLDTAGLRDCQVNAITNLEQSLAN